MDSIAGAGKGTAYTTQPSSPSVLWDSRFTAATPGSAPALVLRDKNNTPDVDDILTAINNELPYVPPQALRAQKDIGKGASFLVSRALYKKPYEEPYYVAVKHVLTRGTVAETHQRYATVIRELRVLLNPSLRNHGCIIQLFGYGWNDDMSAGIKPYLLVDYSEHGTMSQYLQRLQIPMIERLDLVWHIALALVSLHEHGIVHGDVKADNTIVFDYGVGLRPRTAKLADFGSAIFKDVAETEGSRSYLGTARYNPPEVTLGETYRYSLPSNAFDTLCRADIWAFGMFMWESIQNGKDYLEVELLEKGEDRTAFLRRIFSKGTNSLLTGAGYSISKLPPDDDHPELESVLVRAIGGCLQDDINARKPMVDIAQLLQEGVIEEAPVTGYKTRLGPSRSVVPSAQEASFTIKLYPQSEREILGPPAVLAQSLQQSSATVPDLQLARMAPQNGPNSSGQVQSVMDDMFSVLKAESGILPPWKVQCAAVSGLQRHLHPENTLKHRAKAHLELSVAYVLGFGIRPDNDKALHHLRMAASADPIAQAIFENVRQGIAATSCASAPKSALQESLGSPVACAALLPARLWHITLQDADKTIHQSSHLNNAVSKLPASKLQTAEASETSYVILLEACKQGNVYKAMQLCTAIESLEHASTESPSPTPFHWLIMCPNNDVKKLFLALLNAWSSSHPGDAPSSVLNIDSGSHIDIPEHRLKLAGTPLHWAVRSNYTLLAQLLLDAGANVNQRLRLPRVLSHAPRVVRLPDLSPLEIAVQMHFVEMAELLLERGSEIWGGDPAFWERTALHLFGFASAPYEHFVAHGPNVRDAAAKTIRLLLTQGAGLEKKDSDGSTTLARALANSSLPKYILEELLALEPNVDITLPPDETTIIALIVQQEFDRPFTNWKLRLCLNLVRNPNAADQSGRTALHYAAILDSAEHAATLLDDGRVDLECPDAKGRTPLRLAAMMGSKAVVKLLVSRHADINTGFDQRATALDYALQNKHLECATLLIGAGAKCSLTTSAGPSFQGEVLHLAVRNVADLPPIAPQLLEQIPSLRDTNYLDTFDSSGWTPLHWAAQYAQVSSVESLLKSGADPLACSIFHQGSRGGTALQVAQKFRLEARTYGLGASFKRYRDKGPARTKHFMDCLDEVICLLEQANTRQGVVGNREDQSIFPTNTTRTAQYAAEAEKTS